MAYSHVAYTGDGTNAIFNIPFPFLKREFITVNINGIQQPPEDIEWLTDASIRLVKTPPAGSSVLIFRDTAKDKAVVDFRDGSVLTERALDDQVTQLLHITQEVYDVPGQLQSTLEGIESVAQEAADQASLAGEKVLLAQAEADRARAEADRATDMANIGPAEADKLGMVKIGEGIAVEEDGTISVTPVNLATSEVAGTVIVGEGLDITGIVEEGQENPPTPGILSLTTHASEDGEKYGRGDFQFFGHVRLTDDFEEIASASEGIGLSPAGAKAMYDKLLGLEGTTTITSSRDFVAPEAATYRVTVVGGGGSGGSGGSAYAWTVQVSETRYDHNRYSGGGGGGGGAGETLVMDVTLAKGESVPVIVGGPGGNSSFGSYVVSRGGGHGGNGGSGSKTSGIPNGGGGGTSYGSAAGSGGSGKHSTSTSSGLSGGSGGAGGRSTHGQYGHGGNGGSGGGINSNGTYYGPSGGASGTQGVVIVALNLGG